jgi:hypothetical protein
MKNFKAILGALGIIAGIGLSGTAHAGECANYPTVAWWGNLTHEKVVVYVGTRLEGDWNAYTEKWDRQVKKLTDIERRNSSVVIKRYNLRLSGDNLKNYVNQVRQRASINHCLASKVAEFESFGIMTDKG